MATPSPQSGLAWLCFLLPSRPGEFRPEPLTDPCLTVSGHTARATPGRLAPSAETIGFLLLPVDPCRSRLGDPPPSLHENYPVSSLSCNSQVGSCNCFFGACSAFTHVMACTLAESPSDPLHRQLRQLRCLRCRVDCYRVERTSSRAGVAPAEVQRLSRRTVTSATPGRLL